MRDLVQQYLGQAVTVDQEGKEERVSMGFQEPPVGESQSNGAAENAVKQVQKHVRIIRDGLEARYKGKVEGTHPAMTWLVRHAAGVKSRLQKGEDGRTAFERLRGKGFKGKWVEFGECVWYLKPKSAGKYKAESRWGQGIWLDFRDESGEVFIGT